MKIAVFCSGRGSNFKALLKAKDEGKLPEAHFEVLIADNKYAGALNIARENGISTAVIPRGTYHANREGFERRIIEVLSPYQIELVILAGFQRVLGETFLNNFQDRVVNIHPALLPSFPGHMVWQTEVDYGVKLAGATVHFVDLGVDSGPIIIQGAVPVLDSDGPDELANRILEVEHKIFPQAVAWLTAGRVEFVGRKVVIKDSSPLDSKIEQRLIWPPLEN
jgi:phosphoribosylglycinamide formyltransferase-1